MYMCRSTRRLNVLADSGTVRGRSLKHCTAVAVQVLLTQAEKSDSTPWYSICVEVVAEFAFKNQWAVVRCSRKAL